MEDFMKVFLALATFVFGVNTFAAARPCVAVGHTDAQIVNSVLKKLPDFFAIDSIKVQSPNAFTTTVEVSNEKDSMTYMVQQDCNTGALKVSVNNNPNAFVCQKNYIDCMPKIGNDVEPNKYCSQEYANWAMKNCGGAPLIAN
jgi:hypothetical protein